MRYSRKKNTRHQTIELNYKINEQIRVPKVKVIDEVGEFLGVMDTREAIELARERDLTLVEVSPKEDPPLAKIMDYGKLQYQKQKQAKKQQALQKKAETKGIKLSLRIGTNDINVRKNQAKKFLAGGNKVKIELNLKGREKQHKQLALEILNKFINDLASEDEIEIDSPASFKGNGYSATINSKS